MKLLIAHSSHREARVLGLRECANDEQAQFDLLHLIADYAERALRAVRADASDGIQQPAHVAGDEA